MPPVPPSRTAPSSSSTTVRLHSTVRPTNDRLNRNQPSQPATALSNTITRRLTREARDISQDPPAGVTAAPVNDRNLLHWKATIIGPQGSPYEGGKFHLDILFPPTYPFSPPQLAFKTPIYHCNISPKGQICLDTLKHAWSPALTIGKVLLSVLSLLCDPNPDDPLVGEIAGEYKRDRKRHDNNAREWTKKHAVH